MNMQLTGTVRQPKTFGASHRWKVLAAGVVANAAFSAAAAGIPTTGVWMRTDYRLDNAGLGLVLGSIGLGLAVSELPWGVATDRFGDRPVLLTGLAGFALALFMLLLVGVPSGASAPPLVLVAAGMFIVGIFGGSVNGSSGRAVMRWFGESERGLAMSIRQTAVPLGGGIGASLLPWLAASYGFATVYGALALMCAIAALLTWRWLHRPAEEDAGAVRAATPARGPLADGQIWRMAFAIGVLCAPQFAVITFGSVFMHDFGRLGTAGISVAMATVQLGAMIMRVWSGRHTDRHGNRRAYLRASTLVAAGSFVILAAAAAAGRDVPVGTLVMLLVVAGICVSAWHGVAYTELATLAGAAHAGTALGMANTIVYAGLFVTPLAIAHLLARTSWAIVWLVAGIAALSVHALFPRPAARRPVAIKVSTGT